MTVNFKSKLKKLIREADSELRMIIRDTNELGVEYSYPICNSETPDVTLGEKCEGYAHSCPVLGCYEGKKIGVLHTHPGIRDKIAIPSDGDKIYNVTNNLPIQCIGFEAKDENRYVSCYEHPYGLSNKNIKNIKDIGKSIGKIRGQMMSTNPLSSTFVKLEEKVFELKEKQYSIAKSDTKPIFTVKL